LLNHFWHIIYSHTPEEWLDYDETFLELSEGVFRVPGPSAGGDREQARALELGIPVFDYIEELAKYFAPEAELAGDE
jgi:hypothetical protein